MHLHLSKWVLSCSGVVLLGVVLGGNAFAGGSHRHKALSSKEVLRTPEASKAIGAAFQGTFRATSAEKVKGRKAIIAALVQLETRLADSSNPDDSRSSLDEADTMRMEGERILSLLDSYRNTPEGAKDVR